MQGSKGKGKTGREAEGRGMELYRLKEVERNVMERGKQRPERKGNKARVREPRDHVGRRALEGKWAFTYTVNPHGSSACLLTFLVLVHRGTQEYLRENTLGSKLDALSSPDVAFNVMQVMTATLPPNSYFLWGSASPVKRHQKHLLFLLSFSLFTAQHRFLPFP